MRLIARHTAAIHRMQLAGDGESLWFGGADGAIGRVDLVTGQVTSVATLDGLIVGLVRASDSWVAATAAGELAWITESGVQRRTQLQCDRCDSMLDVDVAPDGRIAIAGGREHVHLLSPEGRPIGSGFCEYWTYVVRFARSGATLLAGNWQGSVFDTAIDALADGARMSKLGWTRGPVFALAETTCGVLVAGADDDTGFVAVLDPASGERRAQISLSDGVHAVAPAADDSVAFLGGNDESIRLVRLPDLHELGRVWLPTTEMKARQQRSPYPPTVDYYTALPGAITALAAAADGSHVHVAFADGSLMLVTRQECERGDVSIDVLGLKRTIDQLGAEVARRSAELEADEEAAFETFMDGLIEGRIAELEAELAGLPGAAPSSDEADRPVDRWCEELPASMAAELASALGESYAEAATAVGWIEPAFAWARAPFADGRELTRSRALIRLALALRETDVPVARISGLWIEAFAAAAHGPDGALVDLLVAADLAVPAVHHHAHDRVLETADDLLGAAAIAWYAARAPLPAVERHERAEMIVRVQRTFDTAPDTYFDKSARVALASALWWIQSRAGESEAAGRARQVAIADVHDVARPGALSFVARAAIAAAAELGQLAALNPPEIGVFDDILDGDLVDAFVRSGDTNAALAFVESAGQPARLFARLARQAPDDPRAGAWIDRAKTAEPMLDDNLDEGLLSREQVREARLELIVLRARRGERERASRELAAVAADYREILADASATMIEHLEQVRDGARGPALPADPPKRSLDSDLARWESATDRSSKRRAWRAAVRILEAATALAAAGEIDRARALVAQVIRDDDHADLPPLAHGPLIAAWVALGELDRALAHAEVAPLITSDGITALVVRLAELGRRSQALAFLGPALDQLPERTDRMVLAPAVLATSPDPRAAAAAMLAAWERGNAALDALGDVTTTLEPA